MLAAALRRDGGDRTLQYLEQRLLHALARHIARDGRVVGLARDLVDLVDVDDAALRALDVVVRALQKLEDDVLDVLASAIVNGTSRIRASVCASSVLPEPVGPISRMFDFASSTSLCLVW